MAGWWALAICLMALGLVGTFLPVLPGALIVLAGMVLAAWIDDFQRVGWITLGILGLLTLSVFAIDVMAAWFGAKRVGASRLALMGATVGSIVGLFFGLIGLLIAPFVGAVAGELLARSRLDKATRVGFATWVGMALGMLAKFAVVLVMIGIFATRYLIH